MIVDLNDEILIPTGDVGDFAVVACDQFSADPEYWLRLSRELPSGSALDFILPECFLSDASVRVADISKKAAANIANGRFEPVNGAVYVTRKTVYGRTRHGVVASVDLAGYDYTPGNRALIRASERTLEERIPPRVEIRRAIDIELPHIMLLTDDREGVFARALAAVKKTPLYEGDLKGGGGHIKGELMTDTDGLYAAVEELIAASVEKFGSELFALVGDGNHSLATAKYCAEHFPTGRNSRALVEITDIYDPGLVFEPIHRLVKTEDVDGFIKRLRSEVGGSARTELYADGKLSEIAVPDDKLDAIRLVDAFCERYVKECGGYIEYVHGDSALSAPGCAGIKMRGLCKSELFDYVIRNGVLPKKTFSLGEAEEKRFYVEGRRIK